MGRKISVDSATMMNKGSGGHRGALAVRRGRRRGSRWWCIHRAWSTRWWNTEDGSVLAQLGNPDMRTPIAHALAWPRRLASGAAFLDFSRLAQLEFQAPDFARFPCLRLAFAALEAGGTAPTILNAANEVAVQAFPGAAHSLHRDRGRGGARLGMGRPPCGRRTGSDSRGDALGPNVRPASGLPRELEV
jgi:1-deoxy-D-xylulose-5-phosphate reductoisomerase